MPRERLCKACGQWHELDAPWPTECASEALNKRADGLHTPMMSFDSMKPVQSMTNGLFYDSKSALRSEYRRAGVVEVGNEVPTAAPKTDWGQQKKDRQAAIGKALSRAGFGA